MSLTKGAKQIDGPFVGNRLELCRDLDGLFRRLAMESRPPASEHAKGKP